MLHCFVFNILKNSYYVLVSSGIYILIERDLFLFNDLWTYYLFRDYSITISYGGHILYV